MFFSKLRTELKTLLREFDHYADTHIDTALKVVSAIRTILTSPAADILTAIIPSDVDDAARKAIVAALDKAIVALTIAETCKQYTDTAEKLNCFIQQLKLHDPLLQDALLQKLASLLAGILDGQRLKQSLYDLYTQARYTLQQSASQK